MTESMEQEPAISAASLPSLQETRLERQQIPQARLNLEVKTRSNPLPWRGQFSPELVHLLLVNYGKTSSLVLDPFVGSGTVLLEASREKRAAVGVEVNPAAAVLARVYTLANLPIPQRERELRSLAASCRDLAWHGPLFVQGPSSNNDDLLADLLRLCREEVSTAQAILREALVVLLDVGSRELSSKRLLEVLEGVSRLVRSLPYSGQSLRVELGDARAIPLDPDAVDLVITSPPYINVFNYHQQYRRSIEALGWRPLAAAQSEFGSNRKHRQNRFLTVIQFCLDISEAILELRRVCKQGARIILVVGRESMVRKTRFYNGEIVAQLAAHAAGLPLRLRQERVFTNRFGQSIYEDILHFVVDGDAPNCSQILNGAREVAAVALHRALGRAPVEAKAGIREALAACERVEPSRRFTIEDAAPEREVPIGGDSSSDSSWREAKGATA